MDKKFVVILDFIGNYTKNFFIPIALSGDKSLNKDSLRRFLGEGSILIPGASTVSFEKIAKERIFKSIDGAAFRGIAFIKEAYKEVRQKVGGIPKISDFARLGSIDLINVFESKKFGSYYALLKYMEVDDLQGYTESFFDLSDYRGSLLNEDEEIMLEFISKRIANGKRLVDIDILISLLEHESVEIPEDSSLALNLERLLQNEFEVNKATKGKYKSANFIIKKDNRYYRTDLFLSALKNPFFKSLVKDTLLFGRQKNLSLYQPRYKDTDFTLNGKYTYEDVCRLLRWKQNIVPLNIGGYFYDTESNTFAVFINYHKVNDETATTDYEDRFVNEQELIAISKNNRTIASADMQTIVNAEENDTKIYLFVRKNKDDKESAKEFYFLGEMVCTAMKETKRMAGEKLVDAVTITYHLEQAVRSDIYDYIVNVDVGTDTSEIKKETKEA